MRIAGHPRRVVGWTGGLVERAESALGKLATGDLAGVIEEGENFFAAEAGRLDDALAQYRLTSVMCPDLPWLRALEGTCLAVMGLKNRATPILDGLEQLRRTEYVDAYYMAVFRSALGQRQQAFTELERACAENAAPLFAMNVDPKLDIAAAIDANAHRVIVGSCGSDR